jgi:hypothetical protein
MVSVNDNLYITDTNELLWQTEDAIYLIRNGRALPILGWPVDRGPGVKGFQPLGAGRHISSVRNVLVGRDLRVVSEDRRSQFQVRFRDVLPMPKV